MSVPKIKPSDVVGTAIKGIKELKNRKSEIDDKLEYYQLGKLLQDVLKGKYDKNTIEKDANYVKGLQIEYETKYGKPADEENSGEEFGSVQDKPKPAEPAQNNLPQQTEPKNEKPQQPNITNPFENKPPVQKKKEENKKPEEQPKPQNPPQTNKRPAVVKTKNTGNNNSNNNGVIINGDNNVVFGSGLLGKVQPPTTAPSPEEQQKKAEEDIIKSSKENYSAAFADGAQVAKDLIGPTNTSEKQNAIRLIMKQTKETIMGFIDGFNKNDSTIFGVKYGVGGLIDQVDNEGDILGGITDANWTKSEKKEVFEKIISTVLEWAKDMGFEKDSNYTSLQSILKHVKNDKEIDTERADELIKELISKGMAKAGV